MQKLATVLESMGERRLASPDHRNRRSLRVLAKCGFTQGVWIDIPAAHGEPATSEMVCTFDRTHWFGMPKATVEVPRPDKCRAPEEEPTPGA